MLYPLVFKPIFQERIWGGRNLERLYHKPLPPGVPIGESWEISDRPEADSEILNGPLAGKTLHWLMQNHRADLMGEAAALNGRFPLLVKILDAHQTLSLQVHPPPERAAELQGEPKTEIWYVTRAARGAELLVGLRRGVTREEFERRIQDGSVAECFYRVKVQAGDAMFLPSGRVHAIGAGLVLFEFQQNSDSTYRVFDWNRHGPEGKPRPLHVKESLQCINFDDFEPEPIRAEPDADAPGVHIQTLMEDSLFSVELVSAVPPAHIDYSLWAPRVIGVVEGVIRILHAEQPLELESGEFCLMPASVRRAKIECEAAARFVVAQPGS